MWRLPVLTVGVALLAASGCSRTAPAVTAPPDEPVLSGADTSGTSDDSAAGDPVRDSPSSVPETGRVTAGTAPLDEVVQPDGFDRVRATVTTPEGETCELCLWLATTDGQRRRGLMHVTDLGPADGMAFVYPVQHTGNFWMKNTLLPLSIAFFDVDGVFLESFDMDPCVTSTCPRYPTAPDFLVAVETTQGSLDALGMVPGGVLDLTALPCDD